MYLRKLWLNVAVLFVSVLGAMASPLSYSLGLGEITLNSNLNQPLDADIKLLQVRDLTKEEIFAQLGTGEDFRRRGVERIFFLQDIRFDVRLDNPGGPIVKLTSQKPVIEPFLIFIVQLEWPSGRAQREYTLLMDLPVFSDRPAQPVQGVQPQPRPAQPQPVAPPPVQQAQPQPQPAPPVSQPAPRPATTPPPPLPTRQDPPPPVQPQAQTPSRPAEPLTPSLQSGETYSVRANDTLWEIALNTRPSRGVSVQQTMLALQRLNPDAFINGNINLLKEGQVLRIPDQSEIQELDQRSAVSEVAFQNTQWSGNPDGVVSGAELQGSRVTDTGSNDDDTRRGQLTLASPSDPASATGDRSGSGLSSSERDALENELAITLEQLDSSQRESAELNERVEELEDQIATMERLIEVSSEELRALQLATQENANAAIDLPDPASDDAVDDVVVEDTTDTAGTAAVATDTPPAAVQPPPVAPPVVPAPRQQSFMDMLMDYIWYIGIALIVILMAGFYMWHRKTQAEMDSFDDFDDESFEDQGNMDFAGDDFEDSAEDEDDFDLGMEDEDYEQEIDEPEPVAPTEAQTGDAVGEADIYIAYGKYDQAEEMLQRAIAGEPDNIEARVKLLEVYSETSNLSKFDEEYGQLLALGDASANQRAADLRSAIAGAGEYQPAADTTMDRQFETTDDAGAEDDFDLNLDLAEDDLLESSDDTDSADINFDLENANSGGGELDLGEELDLDLGDDNSLDLDLGDDDGLDLNLEDDSLDDSILGEAGDSELDLSESITAPTPALSDDQTTSDDNELDGIDFNLDLDEDDSSLALDSEELSLDLDDDDLSDDNLTIKMDDDEGVDDEELSLDLDEDDDLSFDLDADEAEFDKEFDAVLDEEPASDPSVNETVSRDFDGGIDFTADDGDDAKGDDDILSDLEFSAATLAAEEDSNEALNENAEQHSADALAPSDDGDDDFDLALGDVDLAALDEEMDALVGDIDDIDDDEVAVSPTEVVPALSDEDLGDIEVDLDTDSDLGGDFDFDTAASDTTVPAAEPMQDDTTLDEDSELDFLADTDEVATKLDLARAYIDMGDKDGAKDILSEVASEGNDEQKQEAQELLGKIN